jgi:tetratricopeptide (TPR) repeat protein
MKVKRFDDAIKLFQQCMTDSRLESDCLVLMGECFLKENKMPLAKRQFEKALPNLNANEKKEQFLTAHYALGRIAEKNGDRDAAENHYNEILAVDYGYMDVAKRLDNLGNIQPGS